MGHIEKRKSGKCVNTILESIKVINVRRPSQKAQEWSMCEDHFKKYKKNWYTKITSKSMKETYHGEMYKIKYAQDA